MLLHYHYHSGHGFGSFFGKLFSKLGAKTVARSIGKVASKAAKDSTRKVLKAATSTTAKKFVKKTAKKGLEKAFSAGSEYAVNKIDSIEKRAINTGISPKLVQNFSSTVKRGAHSGLGNFSNSTVNMMHAVDDMEESAPVKRSKSNIDYSSSVKTESVKTVAPKAVGAATSSIVRKQTRKAAKRAVDSAETSIHSEKKKRMNIKKMKRKLQFGDDRDECCTSPIIIYIYPQNNPGKSVVKHNG